MLVLFGLFFLLLVLGAPITMCMFISSIGYMLANDIPLSMILPRLASGVDSFSLLAVGFFILAGIIMNSGGVTKRIFTWADHLVGHYTGGLAHSNVLASVLFAGMSGSAVADTGGLGTIELKAMKDGGYDEDFSLAVTGASSLLGPIIPPSVPLVLFGVTASVSVGALFNSGIVPGIILAGAMLVLNYKICKKKGYAKRKKATAKEIWTCTKWAFFALLLPVFIRVGIASGFVTPTEAAIVALFYGTFLGFVYKDISFKQLPKLILESLDTTVSVLTLVSAAALFSWVLTFSEAPQKVTMFFMNFTDSPLLALLLIMVLLLALGCFMDITPGILIMTPILMPFITSLGIDPVLFGMFMVLCLLVGLVTPPVGIVLFVLSNVSGVSVGKIAKSIVPYICATICIIILLIIYMSLLVIYPEIPLIYW